MAESTPAPVIQSSAIQVPPIGLNGSGSTTEMGRKLEKQNEELTMQIAQAGTDREFDAKVPDRKEPAKFVTEQGTNVTERFCNPGQTKPIAYTIGVVGILFIVYGLVVE